MTVLSGITVTPTGPLQETGAPDYCKPYVLVTCIDLRPARPKVETLLYGPRQGNHSRATAGMFPLVWQESFWKFDITAAPIAQPNDVILLIALMEHFDGNPGALTLLIDKATIEALDASSSLAREVRIARLIDDTNRSVDFANGGPNLSSATEMRLTEDDVVHLDTKGSCTLVRSFHGYGGHYCLGFEFIRAESDLRNRAPQEHEAFACAA
jgi:hypothetical protein